MGLINENLIRDTADLLGIDDHSLVEKDFYAIQVLKALSEVENPVFKFVFAGGTAMSKALVQTKRMSEDIDVKLLLKDDVPENLLTRNQLRKQRKDLVKSVSMAIEKVDGLKIDSKLSRNESSYNQLMIAYPSIFNMSAALRPAVKLELVHSEDRLPLPEQSKPISSFIAEATKAAPELENFPTVNLELTLSEKLVALGRRTADAFRNPETRPDDERLIRHAYDLHKAKEHGFDFGTMRDTVKLIVEHDRNKFQAQHKELTEDAIKEVSFGLSLILNDPKHNDRYDKYLSPLLYGKIQPSFDNVVASLKQACHAVGFDLSIHQLDNKALEERARAASDLLRNDTAARKEKILAPFAEKQSTLDQTVREAADALAAHQNTIKPSGFFSGKAAKTWESKRSSLLDAASSANKALLKHRQQKPALEKEAQSVARKEAERQNPRAVKDLANWNGRKKEAIQRSVKQANTRSGPKV